MRRSIRDRSEPAVATTPRGGSLLLALPLVSLLACAVPEEPLPVFAGLVSAATPTAARAGVEILESGGNAVDAAVATAFALAVTEPFASGLGGQGVLLFQNAGERPMVLDGTSLAPRALPPEVTADDLVGRRAATVPSMVRFLDTAWRCFGSGRIEWPQLLAPAIRLAEEGYPIGSYRGRVFARYAEELAGDPGLALLLPEGKAPQLGDVVRQPELAATLRRLSQDGADDFYRGALATAIAEDMQVHGGWITAADLENLPEPRVVDPLHSTYRGWDVWTVPPPYGGWVVLQILALLERAPADDIKPGTAPRRLWLAEALRAAHGSRAAAPIRDLTDYRSAVAAQLAPARIDELAAASGLRLAGVDPDEGGAETTHLSVVDGEGGVAALTASINAFFGARAGHPELGLLYNDYMNELVLGDPDHPYALRPGAIPYSSMSPTILGRGGEPRLVLGSPGSRRIISTVAQVASRWVDGTQTVSTSVAAPRLHVRGNELLLEEAFLRRSTMIELEHRGFRILIPRSSLADDRHNPYFGGVHGVARRDEEWRGAADPRRDGAALVARRPASQATD